MRDDRMLERELRGWLEDDGPTDLPDRVLTTALAHAATARRLRPLPRVIAIPLDALHRIERSRHATIGRAALTTAVVLGMAIITGLILAGALLLNGEFGRRNGLIAFEQGGDIWTIAPDGKSPPQRLTRTEGISEGNPVWSADGQRLAYWVTKGAVSEIHIWGPGERLVRLRDPEGVVLPLRDGIFGWSPDGTRIAVPARGTIVADGSTQVGIDTVVVIDVETRQGEPVPLDEPAWSFGWSPTGATLGVVIDDDLLLLDEQTGHTQALSGGDEGFGLGQPYWLRPAPPVFSLDGGTVLYTASAQTGSTGAGAKSIREHGDINRVSVRDLHHDSIVSGDTNDLAPTVSPDGSRVAFGRSNAMTTSGAFEFDQRTREDADLAADLFVSDIDGGAPEVVASGVWPSAGWSPNGARLVARSFEGTELILIDPGDPGAEIRVAAGTPEEPIGGFSWGQRPP